MLNLPQPVIEEEDYFDYFYDDPGDEPGTLSIDTSAYPTKIILIEYDKTQAHRQVNIQPQDCLNCLTNDLISWADIQGLGDEKILQEMGEIFNLHPLVLEDVVHVPQRPKLEDYQEQILIIIHSIKPCVNQIGFTTEQVGIILGKNYLLTFQEDDIDDFGKIRERIKTNQGKVRKLGVDYLAYLLLDTIIDSYFPVLEDYGERIELLEEKIIFDSKHNILKEIYAIRRELLALRRLIWPLRDLFNILIRRDSKLFNKNTYVYLRDCYDHIIQILDILETYRELSSSLMDVQISVMSHRMNEVINLLTIISTIFIPLTFIAGVYGMNFEYMPELTWKWSYFICLGLMFLIAVTLLVIFWRKGWLNSHSLPTKSTLKSQKNYL